MIKRFKLFENSLYKSIKSSLLSDDAIEIDKAIGIDKKLWDYEFENNDRGKFTLKFDYDVLSELLETEEGIISWMLYVNANYSDYSYYYDESEIEYLYHYLDDKTSDIIDELCNMLDIKIERDKIGTLLTALGGNVDVDDYVYEMSSAKTQKVKENVSIELDKLPFILSSSYSGDKNVECYFNVNDIDSYIEEHKLEDINTIYDLFQNVPCYGFSYEDLEQQIELDDDDCKPINDVVYDNFEEMVEMLHEEEQEKEFKDPNQLSLFKDFKETVKKKEVTWNLEQIDEFYSKIKFKNLDEIKIVGGKLLEWLKSYDYQKRFMKENKLSDYRKLVKSGILNPKIEDEYDYLEGANKFNL